jgi:uncharacterized membrane protein HdeD (DUF308 family)
VAGNDEFMRVGYGVGVLLAVLVSLAAYLFGFMGPVFTLDAAELTISTAFLLAGLWTIVAALVVVESGGRLYYASWGIILACLSLIAYVPVAIALGILVVAIIALILVVVYFGGTQRSFTAATSPAPPAGETPAAA